MIEDTPDEQLHSIVAPASLPEDAAHAERLIKGLSTSLSHLSERQQRIFTLSRLQGCSYLEIAEKLQVSASTVQKELKLIMALCLDVAARLDHG
jgi:RNA polymerase sigma factor (sigma-70 family)